MQYQFNQKLTGKMKHLYLIAGHHNFDPGATAIYKGKRITEHQLCILIRDALYDYIVFSGLVDMKYVHKENDNHTLPQVINWLNNEPNKGNRIIFDIHFNAFNKIAFGTEVIVRETATANEFELGKALCAITSKITDLHNRGVKKESQTARKRLGIMRPLGLTLLWEVCFMDNEQDLKKVENNISDLMLNATKFLLYVMQQKE